MQLWRLEDDVVELELKSPTASGQRVSLFRVKGPPRIQGLGRKRVDLGERQRLFRIREPTVDDGFVLEQPAPLIAQRRGRPNLNVTD